MSTSTEPRSNTKKGKPAEQAKAIGGGKDKGKVKLSRLAMVTKLIDGVSDKLKDGQLEKSKTAELIRLLALESQMKGKHETIREIKVTWVEPSTTESSKSE